MEVDPHRLLLSPNVGDGHLFDEHSIARLTVALATHGMLQPPTVRVHDDGRMQVLIGRRRVAAAIRLRWSSVTIHAMYGISDVDAAAIVVAERVSRPEQHPAWQRVEAMAHLRATMDAAGEPTTRRAVSARAKVSLGQTSAMLRIAERLDSRVLELACTDVHTVNTLSMQALKRIVRAQMIHERVARLRQAVGLAPSPATLRPSVDISYPRGSLIRLHLRTSPEALSDEEAKDVVNAFGPYWKRIERRANGL